ncbi:MAG: magnesium transporter, partial [Oxalobacteraceae bacterium]
MSNTGDDMDTRVLEMDDANDGADIYAEDGSVRSDYLMHVGAAIADRDVLYLRQHVARLHASEMGDLLEAINPEQRRAMVSLLGDDFDLSALTEVDEAIRMDIVEHLPNEQIAAALGEMDSDDAVYILEDMDQEDQEAILAKLPFTERVRLRRSLDYPESTAGRRMQ